MAPRQREGRVTINRYWERDPEAPFATLMRFIAAYCHPEAFGEELIELAQEPDPSPAMR